MLTSRLALVSEAVDVNLADLTRVSAALQRQLTENFGPIWGVQATIDCFDGLENVPSGYWTITIRDAGDQSVQGGIHEDASGQPFALVSSGKDWSMSASHEAMEMLADPFSRRNVTGPSPMAGQGQVDFLVEVCDPCQAFGYQIDGVAVSDFVTPGYFDPMAIGAASYSFQRSVEVPLQVSKGGYLSWRDPSTGHAFRQSFFGSKLRITDMGPFDHAAGLNLRSFIYSKTPEAFGARTPSVQLDRKSRKAQAHVARASKSKAASLRLQVSALANASKEN
jgi:hypothetical protein